MDREAILRIQATIAQSQAKFPTLEQAAVAQFSGNIFVSHTARDHDRVVEYIVPAIRTIAGRSFFLLSNKLLSAFQRPDTPFVYAAAVSGALMACRTVIVAISANALKSDWVQWECDTAFKDGHPVIGCSLDSTEPQALNTLLRRSWLSRQPIRIVHFAVDPKRAQHSLERLISSRRFGLGAWKGQALATPRFSGDDFLQSLVDPWYRFRHLSGTN